MSTTPLWVPLVVAALGLVSTVVGIVVTQIMANRRERKSWQRDTDREEQRWRREDQARTFEHRRTAYVQYHESLSTAIALVYSYVISGNDGPRIDLPNRWYGQLFDRLQHVEMYGSPTVIEIARRSFELTTAWADQSQPGNNDESLSLQTTGAEYALLAAIRKDLGVRDESAGTQ